MHQPDASPILSSYPQAVALELLLEDLMFILLLLALCKSSLFFFFFEPKFPKFQDGWDSLGVLSGQGCTQRSYGLQENSAVEASVRAGVLSHIVTIQAPNSSAWRAPSTEVTPAM